MGGVPGIKDIATPEPLNHPSANSMAGIQRTIVQFPLSGVMAKASASQRMRSIQATWRPRNENESLAAYEQAEKYKLCRNDRRSSAIVKPCACCFVGSIGVACSLGCLRLKTGDDWRIPFACRYLAARLARVFGVPYRMFSLAGAPREGGPDLNEWAAFPDAPAT
jgi:hypothetical protein